MLKRLNTRIIKLI